MKKLFACTITIDALGLNIRLTTHYNPPLQLLHQTHPS